jgi:hypothetical protein
VSFILTKPFAVLMGAPFVVFGLVVQTFATIGTGMGVPSAEATRRSLWAL